MRIITFILLLGLLINTSISLTGPKNTFKQGGIQTNCQGSVLIIKITGSWENTENIPTSDFEFKLPLEDGKEASCNYLNSSQSIECKLNGGGLVKFSDTTMKVDEDEYLLQSSNNSISMTCEGDDPDDGGEGDDPDDGDKSSSSMIYSSLLILILLNILLF